MNDGDMTRAHDIGIVPGSANQVVIKIRTRGKKSIVATAAIENGQAVGASQRVVAKPSPNDLRSDQRRNVIGKLCPKYWSRR